MAEQDGETAAVAAVATASAVQQSRSLDSEEQEATNPRPQRQQQRRQHRPSPPPLSPPRPSPPTQKRQRPCNRSSRTDLIRISFLSILVLTVGRILSLQLRLNANDGRAAVGRGEDWSYEALLLGGTAPSYGRDGTTGGYGNNNTLVTTSGTERGGQQPQPQLPQHVYVLPQPADLPSPLKAGEYNHFIRDAVARSARLAETTDPADARSAWVVDVVRCKCQQLVPLIERSKELRLEALRSQQTQELARQYGTTGRWYQASSWSWWWWWYNMRGPKLALDDVPGWNVYLIDYNDMGYVPVPSCVQHLAKLLGSSKFVHFATRKHVKDRKVEPTKTSEEEFHALGTLIDWTKDWGGMVGRYIDGVPRVLRYGVRSDMVEFMEGELNGTITERRRQPKGDTNDDDRRRARRRPPPFVDVVTLPRPTDVSHLWRMGADPREGNHRSSLSLALQRMKERDVNNTMSVFLGESGARMTMGRNRVQRDYVHMLLRSKIVVVSQRDRWEDHYRLMEALAAGAMVMTDPMSYLPLYLEDGVSVVVYRSVGQLVDKIRYYLRNEKMRLNVARRGQRIVMEHHRSWHGLERIIFGNWSSPMGVPMI